jgi:polyphosphate kinase
MTSPKRPSLPDVDAKKRRKSTDKPDKKKKKWNKKRLDDKFKRKRKSEKRKSVDGKLLESAKEAKRGDSVKKLESKKLDSKKLESKKIDAKKVDSTKKEPVRRLSDVKKRDDSAKRKELSKKDIKKIVKASTVPFLRGTQGLGNIFNMPSRPLLKPLLKKTPSRPSPLIKKLRPVSPLVPFEQRSLETSPSQKPLKRKRTDDDQGPSEKKSRMDGLRLDLEKPPLIRVSNSPQPSLRDASPSPVPSVLSALSYLADADRAAGWQREFVSAAPLLKPTSMPKKPSSRAGSVGSLQSAGSWRFRATRPMGSIGSGTVVSQQKVSSTAPPEFKHSAPANTLVNRELSWLDFNARVLSQSQLRTLPVLDRCKFLAIFTSNLDEFWQVRVGRLVFAAQAMDQAQQARPVVDIELSQDGLTPAQQLLHIRQRTAILGGIQDRIWNEEMKPALAESGVIVSAWNDLGQDAKELVSQWFMKEVFVVCTPLSVDGTHPFPRLPNLSINVAVVLTTPGEGGIKRLAIIPLPLGTFPRLVNVGKVCLEMGGEEESQDLVLVPLEEVIAGNLQEMFPGMVIESCSFFRLTRYSDLRVDDMPDASGPSPSPAQESLRQRIERHVTQAKRTEPALRIEVSEGTPSFVTGLLMSQMGIHRDDVYTAMSMLDQTCLWSLVKAAGHVHPHLIEEPTWEPRTPLPFDFDPVKEHNRIFDILGTGRDILVHHPYHNFSTTVESFVESASADPGVMAIKLTLYRTSDEPSNALLGALQKAAERGKQVVVLVELKARFHEILNVGWAKMLERAGAHVVYGLEHLKTHAKICLVIRREQGVSGTKIARYLHVATGNYNAKTAGTYEDLGLFTADAVLAQDASDLFNYLTGWSRHADYQRFVVAPLGMRADLTDLIATQAGLGARGRIFIKCNSLSDAQIIVCGVKFGG